MYVPLLSCTDLAIFLHLYISLNDLHVHVYVLVLCKVNVLVMCKVKLKNAFNCECLLERTHLWVRMMNNY